MKIFYYTIIIVTAALMLPSCAEQVPRDPSTTVERRLVREGNNDVKDERFAEAEIDYTKAINANDSSAIARVNKATALLGQTNLAGHHAEGEQDPTTSAVALLDSAFHLTVEPLLASQSQYDAGNVAYAHEDYAKAVERYKNALRCNPDDDDARDNLRLAQLKLQQQQQQQQQQSNGGGNNNNQDQDQDQNQDNKQDQKQNNNQDNNQDNNKDKNDKQNQDQQDQQGQNSPDKKEQQQQSGMSEQGVEQVLKAVQDRERAAQQKANAERAKQERRERQRTGRKW